MADSLATRRPPAPPVKVGALPPATSGMSLDDALEMTKVSRPEFALMAATTFKESRSLEELVSNIVFAQRRGLDPLSRQVYFEKFDGSSPSLTTGIDGLRSIAFQTGKYAGSSEPVYRGTWEMPTEHGDKPVPAQCLVTVWAMVNGQKCAFEATAFMDESYPGVGGRGRMWRQMPKRMLAVAAERQALRKAFPTVLGGIGDHEDLADVADEPERQAPRTSVLAGMSDAEKSQLHDTLYREPEELPAPAVDVAQVDGARSRYYERLKSVVEKGIIPDAKAWALRRDASLAEIESRGRDLAAAVNAHTIASAQGLTTSEGAEPGGHTSPPPASPAGVRSELWAEHRRLTTKAVELGMRVPTLNSRCTEDELAAANDALRASIKAIEADLLVDPADREPAGQESLV